MNYGPVLENIALGTFNLFRDFYWSRCLLVAELYLFICFLTYLLNFLPIEFPLTSEYHCLTPLTISMSGHDIGMPLFALEEELSVNWS